MEGSDANSPLEPKKSLSTSSHPLSCSAPLTSSWISLFWSKIIVGSDSLWPWLFSPRYCWVCMTALCVPSSTIIIFGGRCCVAASGGGFDVIEGMMRIVEARVDCKSPTSLSHPDVSLSVALTRTSSSLCSHAQYLQIRRTIQSATKRYPYWAPNWMSKIAGRPGLCLAHKAAGSNPCHAKIKPKHFQRKNRCLPPQNIHLLLQYASTGNSRRGHRLGALYAG